MASDPQTWTALKTSLANWIDRDDLSTTEIPEAIALFERRAQRLVFAPEREAALSLSASARSVALPSDFWGIKNGPYVDAATDVLLERLTVSQLIDDYPDGTTGTPCHFAIDGENMLLGPTPTATTSIKGTYWQAIPVLSGSNATNWLLTDHPDVYMWGSLAELHSLMGDEAREARYEAKMRTAIADLIVSSQRRTINSGPLTATNRTRSIRNIRA